MNLSLLLISFCYLDESFRDADSNTFSLISVSLSNVLYVLYVMYFIFEQNKIIYYRANQEWQWRTILFTIVK